MTKSKRWIPIIDPGHGGMRLGTYLTPGKRSPKKFGTPVLYEGAWNRWIANQLKQELDYRGIPYAEACTGYHDTSLTQRIKVANQYYAKRKDVYLLSLHANAAGGTGIEIYTSPGATPSDPLATKIINHMRPLPIRVREDLRDGDPDKEAKFRVLVETSGPAMLLEGPFMDNVADLKLLWDRDFQAKYVNCLANGIEALYRPS